MLGKKETNIFRTRKILKEFQKIVKEKKRIVVLSNGSISENYEIDYEFKHMKMSFDIGEFVITIDEQQLLTNKGIINYKITNILQDYIGCPLLGDIEIVRRDKKMFDTCRKEKKNISSHGYFFINEKFADISGIVTQRREHKNQYLLKDVLINGIKFQHLWFSSKQKYNISDKVFLRRKIEFYYKHNICKLGIADE